MWLVFALFLWPLFLVILIGVILLPFHFIHDRCGTSILAANFVTSVIFLLLLLQTGAFNVINVLLAILLAQIIGPVAGKIVQRYLTTSARVDDFQIVGVEYKARVGTGFVGLPINLKPTEFFVRTRRANRVTLNV